MKLSHTRTNEIRIKLNLLKKRDNTVDTDIERLSLRNTGIKFNNALCAVYSQRLFLHQLSCNCANNYPSLRSEICRLCFFSFSYSGLQQSASYHWFSEHPLDLTTTEMSEQKKPVKWLQHLERSNCLSISLMPIPSGKSHQGGGHD